MSCVCFGEYIDTCVTFTGSKDVQLSKEASTLHGMTFSVFQKILKVFQTSMPAREKGPLHRLLMNAEQLHAAVRRRGHSKRKRPEYTEKYRECAQKGYRDGWQACRSRLKARMSEVLQKMTPAARKLMLTNMGSSATTTSLEAVCEEFYVYVGEYDPAEMPSAYNDLESDGQNDRDENDPLHNASDEHAHDGDDDDDDAE
jgi:hypothetical protein